MDWTAYLRWGSLLCVLGLFGCARPHAVVEHEAAREELERDGPRDPDIYLEEEPPVLGVQPAPLAVGRAAGGRWIAQGPRPIVGGFSQSIPQEAVGAVRVVLPHPTDPDVLWCGSVNGGVWRTDDATSANPHWISQTDGAPSLSIGALELDPTDPTAQTLVAGIGLFSSFGRAGGALTGLLRTTDGGESWTPITHPLLLESITAVAARGSTLVAAASTTGVTFGGLFRSVDGGASWTKVSGTAASGLPLGAVLEMVGDPLSPTRLYAAVKGVGIYRSDDTGAKWRKISSSDPKLDASFVPLNPVEENNNTGLSVASTGRLYVAVLRNGSPRYIGYSDDPTAIAPTWTAMDFPALPAPGTGVVAGASNATPIVITTISGAVLDASNTAPIVITSPAHQVETGNWIQVKDVLGNTAANGTYFVTRIDADQFSLDGTVGNGAYAGGGTWLLRHGIVGGELLEVSGVTGNTAANGFYVVAFVSASQFALEGSSGNGAYAGGGSWSVFYGTNPAIAGSQGQIHFSLRVDPADPHRVHIGGDRQPGPYPNLLGAEAGLYGILFRGDASVAPSGSFPSPQWAHLTHSDSVPEYPAGGTASDTAPHADSRDLAIDAAGNLIESDDGGIYRRTSPADNTGDWYSIIGDLETTEFHSIAYDTVSNEIFGGTQDNATPQQLAPGSGDWGNLIPGDGGYVAVDTTSRAGMSIRYLSAQVLFNFTRRTLDAAGRIVLEEQPALEIVDGTKKIWQFYTPIELNAVDARRMVFGGFEHVFETLDRGETLFAVDTSAAIRANRDALAYGGRIGAVENPDVLWAADGSELWLRTAPYPAWRR